MLSAFFTSALFLVSYVIYHWFKSGPKPYLGEFGLIYYPVLLTHIILAMLILPLAMITLYRGWVVQIQAHKKNRSNYIPNLDVRIRHWNNYLCHALFIIFLLFKSFY